MRGAHPAEDSRLQHVRVLVLVDQDVIVHPTDPLAEIGRRLEHQSPEEQEIVVVDQISFLLSPDVVAVDLPEILEVVDELRILVANDVVDRRSGVDVARVDVLERLLLGESLDLGGVAELGAGELHEIRGIALIHDGEIFREARGGSVAAQQTMRGGVESPTVYALAVAPDEAFGAREHLLRCAARKRQQEYSVGGDAALDQMRDPIDERPGFSGSGAGDDEKWSVHVRRGGRLLRVELRGEIAQGGGCLEALARRIDLKRFRHATVSRSAERVVTTAVRSNASANLADTRSLTSCAETFSIPSSRASDVMTTPLIPQGTMRSK